MLSPQCHFLNFRLLCQPQVQNLDEIVVSVPQTPAHGAVARLPSQVNKTQRYRTHKHIYINSVVFVVNQPVVPPLTV